MLVVQVAPLLPTVRDFRVKQPLPPAPMIPSVATMTPVLVGGSVPIAPRFLIATIARVALPHSAEPV